MRHADAGGGSKEDGEEVGRLALAEDGREEERLLVVDEEGKKKVKKHLVLVGLEGEEKDEAMRRLKRKQRYLRTPSRFLGITGGNR
ncbi:unnamed protein product [Linum trigynum]|uniref:Uncharacterized protein n=1 Tax=Linum trigynum TaxID=586398 RepID=A0AAV2E0B5_9ROSI